MKLRKPKPNEKPKIIEWVDVISTHRKDLDELKQQKPSSLLAKFKTTGWIIFENKDLIILATEYDKDEADITVIPKGLIKRVR